MTKKILFFVLLVFSVFFIGCEQQPGVDLDSLKGEKGDTGDGISSITKTNTEGLVDTYTITFTDGSTTTFTVTNGEQGIQGIQGEKGEDGKTPVITIGENGNWFIDGVDTLQKAQGIKGDTGNGISSITKTNTEGLVDTYTITFTDGSTTTFTVTNGKDGAQGEQGIQGIQGEKGVDGKTPVITIGENGNWFIDGVDTLLKAQGIQGEKGADGKTPVITIGENGNWFIDGVDTGKLASINKVNYTVTFNPNNGDDVFTTSVEENKKVTKPTEPTKAGYTFLGWFNSYDEKWVFGGYNITEDITLTAKWERIVYLYTLVFDNGESNITNNIYYNDALTLSIPTKENNTFLGWYDENDTLVETTYNYLDNKVFTAKWKHYSIKYMDGDTLLKEVDYNKGDILNNIYTPTKENYKFLGWYIGNQKIEEGYELNNDNEVVLTSKWSSLEGLYEYTVNEDNTVTITGYVGTDIDVVIPSIIANKEVTSIANTTFKDNTSVEKITLSKNITNVQSKAFEGCTSLKEVVFNTGISTYGEQIFLGCTSLEKISIDCINKALVTFFDYTDESVPSTFNTIEFLSNITRDNITKMFASTSKINNVIIGDGVTKIGDNAFYEYSNLTSITIHDSVTSIGDNAFYECSKLTNITIPNSVTNIGFSAFRNCYFLKNAYYNGTIEDWCNIRFLSQDSNLMYCAEHFFIKNEFNEYYELIDLVIPNTISSIDAVQFAGFQGTTIIIPNSVINIGYSAFENCKNLSYVIYEGTKSDRFNITIRSNNDCLTNATWLYSTDNVEQIDSEEFKYLKYGNNIVIQEYKGNISNLDLGINFDNNYTIEILPLAFKNKTNLNSIIIPDNVTKIGKGAFNGCSNLESITLPFVGNSSDVTSGETCEFGYIFGSSSYEGGVFTSQSYYGSYYIPSSLKTVIITGDEILNGAFRNCDNLTNITIPNSVTSIGTEAFYNCSNLTSITLGNGVTSIGEYAFYGCYKLVEVINKSSLGITKGSWDNRQIALYALNVKTEGTSDIVNVNDYLFYTYDNINYLIGYIGNDTDLVLPDKYNNENYEINNYAFYNCDNITSITIPNSVTSIGSFAFYDCSNLTSITIPNSVTSIGEYAFSDCSNLSSIYYEGTSDNWSLLNIYSDIPSNTKVYFYSKTQPETSNTHYYYDESGKPVLWIF